METKNYTYKTKKYSFLTIPALAAAITLISPSFIALVSILAHGQTRKICEPWESPLSLIILGLLTATEWTLGGLGTYLLLTRCRPKIAVVFIAFCCLPAYIAGAIYFHALCIFLTLV
jgi:hypothetical protein